MATTAVVHVADEDMSVKRVKWLLMANGDSGASIKFGAWQDRTVQITGTFGTGGSVTIQGSNEGGTTWATLTDPLGNALTFTAAGMKQITELTYEIRPTVTAGDVTTSLNVWLAMRGNHVG